MKWLWKFKSKQQEININKLLKPIIILGKYILDKITIIKHLNIMKWLWKFKSKQEEKNIMKLFSPTSKFGGYILENVTLIKDLNIKKRF